MLAELFCCEQMLAELFFLLLTNWCCQHFFIYDGVFLLDRLISHDVSTRHVVQRKCLRSEKTRVVQMYSRYANSWNHGHLTFLLGGRPCPKNTATPHRDATAHGEARAYTTASWRT
jgi:hypothetical protein